MFLTPKDQEELGEDLTPRVAEADATVLLSVPCRCTTIDTTGGDDSKQVPAAPAGTPCQAFKWGLRIGPQLTLRVAEGTLIQQLDRTHYLYPEASGTCFCVCLLTDDREVMDRFWDHLDRLAHVITETERRAMAAGQSIGKGAAAVVSGVNRVQRGVGSALVGGAASAAGHIGKRGDVEVSETSKTVAKGFKKTGAAAHHVTSKVCPPTHPPLSPARRRLDGL